MRKIIYLFLMFAINKSYCQTNTDFRPQVKSPEVTKFEQYMNLPVNLVSGTTKINIPIYNLEYGGMSLPINIEYDASGVKVESIASSIGQNWSLNIGGVVSRIIKGAPDEGNPYNWQALSNLNVDGFYQDYGLTNLESQLNIYPNNAYTPNEAINRAIQYIQWAKDLSNGLKDSQPDLFYFTTPEGGSKFIFNNNRQIVYLENTDFTIKENDIPNYIFDNDFKSWKVTSPYGIKYKFGIDNPTGFQGRGNVCEASYNLFEGAFDLNAGAVNRFLVNS